MATPNYPATPNLDKRHTVRDKSRAIEEFLCWLDSEKGLHLAVRQYGPIPIGSANERGDITHLLSAFFGINHDEMDRETMRVLEWLHSMEHPFTLSDPRD